MEFYSFLEKILTTFKIDEKEIFLKKAFEALKKGELSKEHVPKSFPLPSYAFVCKIVDPKELPLRKEFHTKEGLAKLLHAIAHIEFSAIDLAVDAVYRYPFMPREYKYDWLVVAEDEIRHFRMIEEILRELGYKYGDFPVHTGLMDAAQRSKDDILERMAIIPRYYEAGGLDANPQIMKKLSSYKKNPSVKKSIEALSVIYEEEISHVRKGDKWFKYLCKERGVKEDIYFEILDKYSLLNKHRAHINKEARKIAGFSCEEIIKLGSKEC